MFGCTRSRWGPFVRRRPTLTQTRVSTDHARYPTQRKMKMQDPLEATKVHWAKHPPRLPLLTPLNQSQLNSPTPLQPRLVPLNIPRSDPLEQGVLYYSGIMKRC